MVKEGNDTLDPTVNKLLLEAIRKIKHQKQRPTVERIINAVNQVRQFKTGVIQLQLEIAVKAGTILRFIDKHGVASYRDPENAKTLKTRKLKIGENVDLTKIISRSINELREAGGSTLKTIEKFICTSYDINLENNLDFSSHLRLCAKRAVNLGKLVQEGRHFKTSRTNGYESTGTGSTISEISYDKSYKVIVEKLDKPKVSSALMYNKY